MARKFYSAILCALALLFAGCSSHPPSAAQFMNVKKEEGKFNNSFNAGVFLLRGDTYRGTSHIDEDYGDDERGCYLGGKWLSIREIIKVLEKYS